MNNDLISRSALIDAMYDNEFQTFCPLDEVSQVIDFAPAVDAEPVRHDKCRLCKIKETGHGIIAFPLVGWQFCIAKRDKGYFMVVSHGGEQVDIPIDYCPNCGAKMDLED